MKPTNRLNQLGATPGKLALIAVLALVLVFVIVRQLPSGGSKQAANVKQPPVAQAKEQPSQPPSETKTVDGKKQVARWPEIDLGDLLVNDPFAKPEWAAMPKEDVVEEDAGKLADLQKQGATVVMITSDSKSASIGERNVHVGDVLEGYQITDITAQGIVLHKLSSQ